MSDPKSKKNVAGRASLAPPELTFEAALARLEAIVAKLDDGNLPLAQALALYKEGNTLAKRCRALLTEAEVDVKEALAGDKPTT